MNERAIRYTVIGVAVAMLLAVLGVFAYRVYDSRVNVPNSTVLTVGDETVSLRYYTDRLGPFVQANASSGASLPILHENLLTKLEEEALVVRMAEAKGIDLSDEAVTAFIAEGFGVPVGGAGTSYDAFYRNQLRTTGLSDASFRRMKRAELADARMQESLKAELAGPVEQYTVRVVLTATEEEAAAVHARIAAGEDMGSIAQVDSIDLESRQTDGLLPAEPLELFPEEAKAALEGAEPGALAEPMQIGENWWVMRLESIAEAELSEGQIDTLATSRMAEAIDAERAALAGQIDRSLSSSDIEWAEEHATLPTGS